MNWKERFNAVSGPLVGAALGLMIYAWVKTGSPWNADWIGGAIMIAAFMAGRGIRLLAERTDRIECERAPTE